MCSGAVRRVSGEVAHKERLREKLAQTVQAFGRGSHHLASFAELNIALFLPSAARSIASPASNRAFASFAPRDRPVSHYVFHYGRGTAKTGCSRKCMKDMVRPERFELPTFWFVARRSIQLS